MIGFFENPQRGEGRKMQLLTRFEAAGGFARLTKPQLAIWLMLWRRCSGRTFEASVTTATLADRLGHDATGQATRARRELVAGGWLIDTARNDGPWRRIFRVTVPDEFGGAA